MSAISPKRLCDSVSVFYHLHILFMLISALAVDWLTPDFNDNPNRPAYQMFLFPQFFVILTVIATLYCDMRGAYRAMKSCAVRLVFSIICSSGCLGVLYMSGATLSLASLICLALIPAIILVWSVRKLCNLWQLVFSDIKDYCQDRPDLKWGVTKWILRKWRKFSSMLHLRDRCSMKWEFVIEVGFKALSWVLIWALIYFAIYIHRTHIN